MQLTIKNLTKKYNSKKIGLSDYSIDISSGILGVLGPNGAGKSTLMKMISTITKPTQGTIFLNENDIVKHPNYMRQTLGYLPQDFGVYPNLNAYEFLAYMAAMKGVGGKNLHHRIETLLEEVNLTDAARNQLKTYSGGMIQRIGIAQALLNDPKVLIFDEPTVGLDPEERLRFRDLISDLATNRIVILSSHIVSDIESIADEVAIMKKGNLIVKDKQDAIVKLAEGKVYETMISKSNIINFKSNFNVVSSYRVNDQFKVRYTSNAVNQIGEMVTPTLEDAYIYLTKN
ncbi:ABC transporter ATP-binding protein [uncultured Tenacibaculum sp.]|uniref:ABC transporter ATP-binding protein n=1 Tax=uncultured Tenacibaculum sp. TaxID=174713 RepID=UPI002604BE5D|nr:ABC transporter ATP-binding protein [uncultured Tenacibaculum sp.]